MMSCVDIKELILFATSSNIFFVNFFFRLGKVRMNTRMLILILFAKNGQVLRRLLYSGDSLYLLTIFFLTLKYLLTYLTYDVYIL